MNNFMEQWTEPALAAGFDAVGALNHGGRGYLFLLMACRKTPVPPNGVGFVSDYYFASNRAYHTAHRLAEEWTRAGRDAEVVVDLPVKPMLLQAFPGMTQGKNSLTFHPILGSYFAAQVICCGEFPDAPAYDPERWGTCDCGDCRLCLDACPVSALEEGFCRDRCLRNAMDHPSAMAPSAARKMGVRVLGCENCQRVCPKNAAVSMAEWDEVRRELFSLKGLLDPSKEKMAALREAIGANYAQKNRLRAMALIAALHDGTLSQEDAERFVDDPSPQVRETAKVLLLSCRVEENRV